MKIIQPYQIFIIFDLILLVGLLFFVIIQEDDFADKSKLNYEQKQIVYEGEVLRKIALGKEDAYLIKISKKGESIYSLRKGKASLLFVNNGERKRIIGENIIIHGDSKILEKGRNTGFYSYLRKYRVEYIVYGDYRVINSNKKNYFSLFKVFISRQKEVLSNYILNIWGREKGGIVKALLIADKSLIDKETKNDLSVIGITHIFAISGLHIGIIIECLSLFLCLFGLNRKRLFFFINFILLIYLFFIDFPSSALRAYFMFLLNFLGLLSGRKVSKNLNLLVSLNLIIIFNPFLLIYDVGLKLSFLASFSLINIFPIISKITERILIFKNYKIEFFNKVWEYITSSIIASLSVMIGTFPVLITEFGYFSIVSILANLLFLWIVPFLLIFSFLILLFKYFGFFIWEIFMSIQNIFFDYFYFCKELVLNLKQFNFENASLDYDFYWIWVVFLIFLFWSKKDYEKEFNLIKNY